MTSFSDATDFSEKMRGRIFRVFQEHRPEAAMLVVFEQSPLAARRNLSIFFVTAVGGSKKLLSSSGQTAAITQSISGEAPLFDSQ